LFSFLSAPISGIEQPANRGNQDENQDNRMKLENQEKKKRSSDQKKDGD
jgi:hypothetical protein